jgi:CheY-specific phosphatase CheX
MNSDQNEILQEVFFETAESLAFMFGEPSDAEDLPAPDGDCVLVAMEFKGEFSGTVELAVPAIMRTELAANILGVDPDSEKAREFGEDALNELLNVTTGQLLTRIAGEGPVFDLTVPKLSPIDEAAWQEMAADPEALCVTVDDNPAVLRLSIQP